MVRKGGFFVDYTGRPLGVRLSPPDDRDFPVSAFRYYITTEIKENT
ncbi:MAG: hypothetical protein ACOY30_08020 [Bacillota bacterium]